MLFVLLYHCPPASTTRNIALKLTVKVPTHNKTVIFWHGLNERLKLCYGIVRLWSCLPIFVWNVDDNEEDRTNGPFQSYPDYSYSRSNVTGFIYTRMYSHAVEQEDYYVYSCCSACAFSTRPCADGTGTHSFEALSLQGNSKWDGKVTTVSGTPVWESRSSIHPQLIIDYEKMLVW